MIESIVSPPLIFYRRLRRKLCHLRHDCQGAARWSNLIATTQVIPRLRTHFRPNVPPSVNIGLTTDCNYKCPFCPQSTHKRASRYITAAAFRYIVEEMKRVDFVPVVILSNNSEAFLHPHLVDFCEMISAELPKTRVCLFTNGSLLTRDHLRAFVRMQRPPVFTVNDYTPDHRVKTRLVRWLAELPPGRINATVRERSWSETLSNRAGNQPGSAAIASQHQDIVCTWPFSVLVFTPELKAILCCNDYRHEMIVGDLNTDSLMEIWTGPVLAAVRRKMLVTRRSNIPLCSRCDAEWESLPEHCRRKDEAGWPPSTTTFAAPRANSDGSPS